MITCKGITKNFGNIKVLKGIDIIIPRGKIVSIIGASGVGKTTLLQIIGTLDAPNTGKVFYECIDVFKLKEREKSIFRNKNIGFIFQFHQLLPEFTALENVMIPALIGKSKLSEAKKRAKEILNFLKLSNRLEHKPYALSGGEKQRVAVARALINEPLVILADEPSGSLDTKNKKELHQLFFSLKKNFNQTFVIVTHDENLAKSTDLIIYMKDGKIHNKKT
ncbi:MAG: ABC transporter ATP-binding protein [Bacteroidales bacterium OttesenSCG-928-I14]|jgi:lipoprotein-releasing system ATP-binding protein|nr:ABC transporter ATP-binding protein [Bacteroidales bacterium OttesenSCG-928-I14]